MPDFLTGASKESRSLPVTLQWCFVSMEASSALEEVMPAVSRHFIQIDSNVPPGPSTCLNWNSILILRSPCRPHRVVATFGQAFRETGTVDVLRRSLLQVFRHSSRKDDFGAYQSESKDFWEGRLRWETSEGCVSGRYVALGVAISSFLISVPYDGHLSTGRQGAATHFHVSACSALPLSDSIRSIDFVSETL